MTVGTPLGKLTADDAAWIKKNISGGAKPEVTARLSTWELPRGIAPAQFRTAYVMADTAIFGVIRQNNQNVVLETDDQLSYGWPVSFAGLIFSADRGQTWKQVFAIPTSTVMFGGQAVHMNVVGLSLGKNSDYILDIADDHGAGSGEGNLMRLSSKDGKTWMREKRCYYLMPEVYWKNVGVESQTTSTNKLNDQLQIAEPFQLDTTPCPPYARTLDQH